MSWHTKKKKTTKGYSKKPAMKKKKTSYNRKK